MLWQELLSKLKDETTFREVTHSFFLDRTYYHLLAQIRFLQKEELVHIDKGGRDLKLTLTKKGKAMRDNMKQLKEALDGN